MNNTTLITALSVIIASAFPTLATIIAFILNPNNAVRLTRKEDEYKAMDWTCGSLFYIIANPAEINNRKGARMFNKVQRNIFLYGTNNEKTVMSYAKPKIFLAKKNPQAFDKYFVISVFCLLLNVIHHETYKKKIVTDYVLKTTVNDYDENGGNIVSEYNNIVSELKFNKKYLIR